MESQKRKDHRDLIVWQKAMELAAETHRVTRKLPPHEMFGLVSQVRRAAVSVPSNIAEGAARRTTREFIAFLHVARGSLAELQTQLQLAQRVGYLTDTDLASACALMDTVGRLVNAVISGLRRRQVAAL
jgi:four helix bundle protein